MLDAAALGCMDTGTADDVQPQVYAGTVKWFSAAKGYGFVDCSDFDADVLLHGNVLGDVSGLSLTKGARIEFMCRLSGHGPRVTQVLSIETAPAAAPLPVPEEYADLPLIPARVKWFDGNKGFGFATAFGDPQDIFVHASVLQQIGETDLTDGEAISIRTKLSERGLIAVDIRPWSEGAE